MTTSRKPKAKAEPTFKQYARKTWHTYKPGPNETITLAREGEDVHISVSSHEDLYSIRSYADVTLTRADWNRLTELFYRALGDETE